MRDRDLRDTTLGDDIDERCHYPRALDVGDVCAAAGAIEDAHRDAYLLPGPCPAFLDTPRTARFPVCPALRRGFCLCVAFLARLHPVTVTGVLCCSSAPFWATKWVGIFSVVLQR